MTTLRRLLVAVYPIRLFLLALAWGIAADVRAQEPVTIGYYDMSAGAGIPEQAAPIVAAGFTPVALSNVTAPDLAGLHILFVENPSLTGYGAEYLAGRPAIQAAVSAGMVLVIHDRTVLFAMGGPPVGAKDILPGGMFIFATKTGAMMASSNNIDVSDPSTLVASGPLGTLTDASLDGGMQSNHGYVNLLTAPAGRKGLLHTVAANQAVTFSYPFGLGYVIYSTIPIDMFLKNTGMAPPAVKDAFKNIYAPNVLAYAACGLKALPSTVSATSATGHYGGTVTLSANVNCGVLPVAGAEVVFSLNGGEVGHATTDASGNATLSGASLGLSPESAIAVGTYPTGVSASFAGTAQYGAGSGTAALTVEKAPATITYSGGAFTYDGMPHAATGSVTGVFNEPLGTPSFTYTDQNGVTSDAAPVNAGVYDITAASAETDSYLATTVRSSATTIEVTAAALTVTADDKTKVYGAAVPVLTATFDGFVPGEDGSALGGTLSLATEATESSAVAEYAITASGLTSTNYAITFVNGTLSVTPAPLTVRANSVSKIYGAAVPGFTATYEGFVLGETPGVLGGALSFTTPATVASPVGQYLLIPFGLTAGNYAITFAGGIVAVTPAALTIRADDKERLIGVVNPVLTVTYEGFVLGETAAALDVPPTVTTSAALSSPAGTYPIVVSGAGDANYTIDSVDGELTVSPEGRIHGEGFVDLAGARYEFVFDAKETIVSGEKGSLTLRVHRTSGADDVFVSQLVTSLVFKDNPGVAPGGNGVVDSVAFAGLGTWNGATATFEAVAADNGEPGIGRDRVSIRIKVAGLVVSTINGAITGGNVQSNRVSK